MLFLPRTTRSRARRRGDRRRGAPARGLRRRGRRRQRDLASRELRATSARVVSMAPSSGADRREPACTEIAEEAPSGPPPPPPRVARCLAFARLLLFPPVGVRKLTSQRQLAPPGRVQTHATCGIPCSTAATSPGGLHRVAAVLGRWAGNPPRSPRSRSARSSAPGLRRRTCGAAPAALRAPRRARAAERARRRHPPRNATSTPMSITYLVASARAGPQLFHLAPLPAPAARRVERARARARRVAPPRARRRCTEQSRLRPRAVGRFVTALPGVAERRRVRARARAARARVRRAAPQHGRARGRVRTPRPLGRALLGARSSAAGSRTEGVRLRSAASAHTRRGRSRRARAGRCIDARGRARAAPLVERGRAAPPARTRRVDLGARALERGPPARERARTSPSPAERRAARRRGAILVERRARARARRLVAERRAERVRAPVRPSRRLRRRIGGSGRRSSGRPWNATIGRRE